MKTIFPQMTDCPEGRTIAHSILYDLFAFVFVPYIMYWMVWGMNREYFALSFMELVYHGINFLVAVFLFWRYLADSFSVFSANLKDCMITLFIGVLIIIGWGVSVFVLGTSISSRLSDLAALSVLPLSEMDLQLLSSSSLYYRPLFSTICLTLCVPVTVSCLYYATGFAPACGNIPWLGYLLAALIPAVPRLINALTFWDPAEELVIYLWQLPIHLVACWTYQKTDTVWTPIFTLALSNLFGCLGLLWVFGIF